MNDKREMIERALRQRAIDIAFKEPRKYDNKLVSVHWMDAGVHEGINAVINALAEQAIVIECEVEHVDNVGTVNHGTWLWIPEIDHEGQLSDKEMIGTPGKALAIIISLEEE